MTTIYHLRTNIFKTRTSGNQTTVMSQRAQEPLTGLGVFYSSRKASEFQQRLPSEPFSLLL